MLNDPLQAHSARPQSLLTASLLPLDDSLGCLGVLGVYPVRMRSRCPEFAVGYLAGQGAARIARPLGVLAQVRRGRG